MSFIWGVIIVFTITIVVKVFYHVTQKSNKDQLVSLMNIQQCMATEGAFSRICENAFIFPNSETIDWLCRNCESPSSIENLQTPIVNIALEIYNRRAQGGLPVWDGHATMFDEPKCISILYKRTMREIAFIIIELKNTGRNKTDIPTHFTMKNGCCTSNVCPKKLFVEDILKALELYILKINK